MELFNMKKIGLKIKNAREKAGFSQSLLADYLEIHQSLVARYEKGERPISMDSLSRLTNLFRCSLDYFIIDENNDMPLEGIALRGNGIKGEDLKIIAKMNVIISNLEEMEQILEE